jgi:hypothetical protein
VFLIVSRSMADTEPRRDGAYSAWGARVARALREKLHLPPAAPGEHPFVLRGIAEDTRYSDIERRRIDRVRRFKRFTLFERLGIDEAAHDRLLGFAHAPDRLRSRARS